ncbi:MAG: hypothetical protein QOG46_2224, partial [Pseudonocardiales bacterium]|nr:hypothetical protein [Pseudonocardiales bacterium]
QKAVPAESIVVGDQVFRTHTAHGPLMLVVEEIGQDVHAGRKVYVWIGTMYKLEGERTGPKALFLGDMTAVPTCRGVWSIPVDRQVLKGVPKAGACFETG